ncbi:MAG: hypothetical protein HOH19_00255 [Kordiimonadaceae bacterium]|jgi:fructoselysine 6-kinase|nr:hypothetical protein [Kordiimonadaceae bacterium]MBT6030980.1 hypothetical protein [Kordiimonadaceae bacterium]
MKLVTIGDCGVDRYLPDNKLRPGGITANFTRQARICFDATDQIDLISLIGTDHPECDVAFDAVNIANINCHINRYDSKTPIQYIEILDSGEKNFTHYEPGVLEHFYLDEKQKKVLANADLIMTPVYWQIHNVFDTVFSSKLGGTIAVDFSDFSTDSDFELLNKYIDKINIAFFGLNSSQTDLIDQLKTIANEKEKLFVITLGSEGSIAFKNDQKLCQSPINVDKIVDTTGAGDAYAAGFLSQYSKLSLQECMELGTENAAKTIQFFGSVPD